MKGMVTGSSLTKDRIYIRSIVSVFLTSVCLLFALWLASLPFQWNDERKVLEEQNLKELKPESIPFDGNMNQTESGEDKIHSFGKAPVPVAVQDFIWDNSETLAFFALDFFQSEQRNVPALYVAGSLLAERYPAEKKLDMVNAVYVELFGYAYGKEKTASGGEYPESFSGKLMFLENVEKHLTDAFIPKGIADCMILKFAKTQKDSSVTNAMKFLIAFPVLSDRLVDEADLATRFRRADETWFLNTVKESAAETLSMLSGRQSAWLRKICNTPDERNAWSNFRKSREKLRSVRDFSNLPAVFRTMTALRFFRRYGLPGSEFLKKMSSGNYQAENFLKTFEFEARNSSADFLRFLRSNPEWMEHLNKQDYAGAEKALQNEWEKLFPEDPIPKKLFARIQHGLNREREFLEKHIDKQKLQQSLSGNQFFPERFGALIRAASVKLPAFGTREYGEWSKGLACMLLNRGLTLERINQYADVTLDEINRYMNMENTIDAGKE